MICRAPVSDQKVAKDKIFLELNFSVGLLYTKCYTQTFWSKAPKIFAAPSFPAIWTPPPIFLHFRWKIKNLWKNYFCFWGSNKGQLRWLVHLRWSFTAQLRPPQNTIGLMQSPCQQCNWCEVCYYPTKIIIEIFIKSTIELIFPVNSCSNYCHLCSSEQTILNFQNI